MLITNVEHIPGTRVVEHYGIVSGSTVRARVFYKDFFAGIKNFFGGELKTYSRLMEESRDEATKRMIEQAQKTGANTILNVRFSTSSIAAQAAEIYVYGTAVKLEQDAPALSPQPRIEDQGPWQT